MARSVEKTKAQLINELKDIRRRLAESEASQAALRQTEDALQVKEQQLLLLLNNVEDVIFSLSVEPDDCYRLNTVNQGFLEMTGLSESQIIGKRIEEVVPASVRAFVLYKEAVKTRQPVHWEGTSDFPAGKRTGQVTIAPVFDANGNCIQLIGTVHDFTDHKRAEEALSRSEERYRALIATSPDGIALVGTDGLISFASRQMVELLGCQGESEFIGHSPLEWVIAEDREQAAINIGNKFKGMHHPGHNQYRMLKTDGTLIWCEINSSVMNDPSGNPIGLVAVIRDVTERKWAEEELKRSESNYRRLAEALSDLVYAANPETFETMYTSPSVERIYGYTVQEWMASPDRWAEALHPDDKERVLKALEQARASKESGEVEYRIITRNGDTRWMMDTFSWDIGEQGEIRMLFGLARDITGHKRADEEITRFKTISDLAPYGLTMLDRERTITYTNRTCAQLHGYEPGELVGQHCTVLVPEDQLAAVEKLFEKSEKSGGFTNEEIVHKRKDGTTFPALMSGVTVKDSSGKPLYTSVVFVDITEQKKAQAFMMAQDRLASVGQLAAGLAHELNNPLTGIIGFSDLLLTRKDLPDDVRQDLQTVNNEAQRTARIVKGLLTFVRSHRSVKEPVDIRLVIREVLQLRGYEHKVSNIQVNTEFAADLPAVLGNSSQLQQVIVNLVINAEQAMLGVRDRGKLTIVTEHVDDIVRVTVADDGPGITPENMRRLFTPFFTTKEVGKGTGLGLSICHGIVTEHGGKIYARSEPGKGAAFIVELPVAR